MNPDYAFVIWVRKFLIRYGESSISDLKIAIKNTIKELS
jgi:hypothetical protein